MSQRILGAPALQDETPPPEETMATTVRDLGPISAQPIPQGYHSLTPGLTVRDAHKAIDFYKRAFGATERTRRTGPDGRIMYAELQIGDSLFILGEEKHARHMKGPKSLGGTTVSLNLYLDNADATFKQAVDAGAKEVESVQYMFWGDRYGKVEDPDGHIWGLCTRVEDLSPMEVAQRGREWLARNKDR